MKAALDVKTYDSSLFVLEKVPPHDQKLEMHLTKRNRHQVQLNYANEVNRH